MSVLAVQQTGTRWPAQRSRDVAIVEAEPGGGQLVNVGEELLQHGLRQQLSLGIVEIDQDNVGPFVVRQMSVGIFCTFQQLAGKLRLQRINRRIAPKRTIRIAQPDHGNGGEQETYQAERNCPAA